MVDQDHHITPEWVRAKCPNCGTRGIYAMSEVGGHFHYRCPPPCLWSWKRPVLHARPTCHKPLQVNQECDVCGSYAPKIKEL